MAAESHCLRNERIGLGSFSKLLPPNSGSNEIAFSAQNSTPMGKKCRKFAKNLWQTIKGCARIPLLVLLRRLNTDDQAIHFSGFQQFP